MNAGEEAFSKALQKRGFEVLRRGWPDFLVLSKDWKRGFAVEYKSPTDRVRPEQERMHSALARFGLPTYVAGPESTAIIRKRGSALVMPEDYEALREREEQLTSQLKSVQRQLSELQRLVQSLPILLEPPTEQHRELEDIGTLIDAQTKSPTDAKQRQERRIFYRELEQAQIAMGPTV